VDQEMIPVSWGMPNILLRNFSTASVPVIAMRDAADTRSSVMVMKKVLNFINKILAKVKI
jgi:hypothetical protein